MAIIDKSNVLARLAPGAGLSVELGCGPRKRDPRSIGIDLLDHPGVDLVGDVFEALALFPSGSVADIHSSHFFEHIDDVPRLLAELARVAGASAHMTIVVPHFSNPFYYSDPTHRSPFGLYTMAYYCEQSLFRRQLPRYGDALPFRLDAVQLGFKSHRPHYMRHAIKRAVGLLINAAMPLREWYEEVLCWVFPCYEVRYELTRH